ncbi:MAG TPA: GNAT family N-acetyltransferase [Clostridium sp.]|nr:GNAT family N-acetyltransferase [Clostridium sp.]
MTKSLEDENIEKHIFYVNNKPVGFTSVAKKEQNKYYLGNLAIIPEYQHKGIGKAAIDFILNKYLDLKELTLVTPADKIENINFYTKKCGFKIIGTEIDGNVKVAVILYTRK